MARFSAQLEIDLRRFALRAWDTGAWDDPEPERAPGFTLLAASRAAVIIFTGAVMGPVRATVEVLDEDPGPYRHDGVWEDVEEVAFHPYNGTVNLWETWNLAQGGPATLTPHGARNHRVRVACRGRDIDWDDVADEPNEEYLLQIWPAHPNLTQPIVWCHFSLRSQGYH